MRQIWGFFRSDFSAFGAGRQIHWNLIWKSPGFVPFGANLTNFRAKPTIPGIQRTRYTWVYYNIAAEFEDRVDTWPTTVLEEFAVYFLQSCSISIPGWSYIRYCGDLLVVPQFTLASRCTVCECETFALRCPMIHNINCVSVERRSSSLIVSQDHKHCEKTSSYTYYIHGGSFSDRRKF